MGRKLRIALIYMLFSIYVLSVAIIFSLGQISKVVYETDAPSTLNLFIGSLIRGVIPVFIAMFVIVCLREVYVICESDIKEYMAEYAVKRKEKALDFAKKKGLFKR